ncbi:hypothetical protein E6W26_28940 [Pseudomonas aeruginosa]|uniref:hypothetical protein n=1 Tax=Pseudomonas aeruginosa TaxID=287 RepID=UPI00109E1A53|nr:hypothetical protein [Pseudomonas aeruginosa]EKV1241300.1 hypothetical protein [Pseudomonas aeruginosa]EKV8586209.1 hypothetical protein [Pseudomonas aeruginosa]ELN5407427.1 hypothetical protein [Pseudomonas aeruginosa]ELP1438618.1 hypothetical protein [Pseudomonas aeruginosa]THB16426.1 hypothetical protein E6W26_28940 [Pseudomonas aeruginosa]
MRNEEKRPANIETEWEKWTSTDWDIQPGEAEFSHHLEIEDYFQPDSADLATIKSFKLYSRVMMKGSDQSHDSHNFIPSSGSRKESINEFISRLQSNPDDFPIL